MSAMSLWVPVETRKGLRPLERVRRTKLGSSWRAASKTPEPSLQPFIPTCSKYRGSAFLWIVTFLYTVISSIHY